MEGETPCVVPIGLEEEEEEAEEEEAEVGGKGTSEGGIIMGGGGGGNEGEYAGRFRLMIYNSLIKLFKI